MAVTVYKTIQGDMWDTISYRLYGTGDYMHRLMEANPAIADVWVFGGGVVVVVPEIVVDGAGVKLPPWKRGTGKKQNAEILNPDIYFALYSRIMETAREMAEMTAEGGNGTLYIGGDGWLYWVHEDRKKEVNIPEGTEDALRRMHTQANIGNGQILLQPERSAVSTMEAGKYILLAARDAAKLIMETEPDIVFIDEDGYLCVKDDRFGLELRGNDLYAEY